MSSESHSQDPDVQQLQNAVFGARLGQPQLALGPNTRFTNPDGTTVASNPAPADWGSFGYNVKSTLNPSGAAVGAGLHTVFGATINSAQATIAIPDGFFAQAMVGWNAVVPFALNANKDALVTTVLSVQSATGATLAASAGASVAGGQAFFWPASGVGSDDAPQFLAAFNAAPGAGGVVLIPQLGENGFYPLSSLPATLDQHFIGANKRATALFHTGAGTFVQSANRCAYRDFTLFAGPLTTTIWKVLDGSNGDYLNIELDGSCAVNITKGLWVTNAVLNSGGSYYNRFASINSHHSVTGLMLGGNANATAVVNANTFDASQFSWNRDAGIWIQYANGNVFSGACSAEQNGKVGSGPSSGNNGVGVRFNGNPQGTKMYGFWLEGNKNGTLKDDTGAIKDCELTFASMSQYVGDGGGNGLLTVLPLGRNSILEEALGNSAGFLTYSGRRRVTSLTGTPGFSNLGANVTSVTPAGNDVRGRLTIVMSGALAANTRIATITFAATYGAAALGEVLLINQTSGAGLTIVNFYQTPNTGVGFDLFCNQALAAGTYIVIYLVEG